MEQQQLHDQSSGKEQAALSAVAMAALSATAAADHTGVSRGFPNKAPGCARTPEPMRGADVVGGVCHWLSDVSDVFSPLTGTLNFQNQMRSQGAMAVGTCALRQNQR